MNPRNILLRSVFVAALVGVAAACGGSYVPADDDGADFGDDSANDASNDASDGSGGNGTGGTPAGTGGEPPGCCLAAALCDSGDTEIASKDDCPAGAICYSNAVCCSVVWCAKRQPNCDAFPSCESDEKDVSECEANAVCTTRELCGNSILCQKKDGTCDRAGEPDRDYVGDDPASCLLIDYICPEHTTPFSNDCGCGCEQPTECPDFVNCEPGGMVDPLCDSAECPYTERPV
jgi:hypothetical protein